MHDLAKFFSASKVEICDENFVKECFIEYKPAATNETIQVCNERTVRDCDKEGKALEAWLMAHAVCQLRLVAEAGG